MSRCAVDADAQDYDLLRSVAGSPAPDRRLSMQWLSRPGLELPPAPMPAADPWADEGGGWTAVSP